MSCNLMSAVLLMPFYAKLAFSDSIHWRVAINAIGFLPLRWFVHWRQKILLWCCAAWSPRRNFLMLVNYNGLPHYMFKNILVKIIHWENSQFEVIFISKQNFEARWPGRSNGNSTVAFIIHKLLFVDHPNTVISSYLKFFISRQPVDDCFYVAVLFYMIFFDAPNCNSISPRNRSHQTFVFG